jgi:hypothetical protein
LAELPANGVLTSATPNQEDPHFSIN